MNRFALLSVPLLAGQLIAVASAQGTAPAGAPASIDPQAFCQNDPRASVRAYCKDLADLQTQVNADKTTSTDTASGTLNKLDLSNEAATVKFVTATANTLVVQTAISKAAALTASRDASQARPDRQLDANSTASGTTSLVSLPGSAELLALALDTGILTQSINGTSATLSTNADQILRLITGNDPDCTVTCKSLGSLENKIFNPLNVSATMDLAETGNKAVPTSGPASPSSPTITDANVPTGVGKLSGVTARYQLMNKFDPRSAAFKENWKQAVSASALKSIVGTLGSATDLVKNILKSEATPLDRDKILAAAKSDPTGKQLADSFADYFANASQKPMQDPAIAGSVAQVVQARAMYRQAWFDTLDKAVGNLATFEYDYNRPLNQPVTHDFKLIYGYNFQSSGMVTFNGSVSVYGGAIPAGASYGRMHYGQISSEYDRTLSGKNASMQTQLSLAGYWQYQPNPSVLNIPAGTVAPGTSIPVPNGTQEFVGTAGSLWVTQAKVTIKGAGGVNIPIAVSWSNKTDLLQGSRVGGQVGISYNFSSVASLFTGGGSQ